MSWNGDDVKKDNPVVRRDERVKMFFPNSAVSYELMTSMENGEKHGAKMLAAKFSIRPQSTDMDEFTIHDAEEILILMKGIIEVTMGNDVYVLNPGDTIYIMSNIPHKVSNIGESFAEGYYIVTPPGLNNL